MLTEVYCCCCTVPVTIVGIDSILCPSGCFQIFHMIPFKNSCEAEELFTLEYFDLFALFHLYATIM